MHSWGINPVAGFVKDHFSEDYWQSRGNQALMDSYKTWWFLIFFLYLYQCVLQHRSKSMSGRGWLFSCLRLTLSAALKPPMNVAAFLCKNSPPTQTKLLFCHWRDNLNLLYFINNKKHFCSPVCSFACLLLPDQILLSSSFNAYVSWNIRHQIRAVSNSAEWMVLLLQGLTYHCHKRRKTIQHSGHWCLLLKDISRALEEILAAVSQVLWTTMWTTAALSAGKCKYKALAPVSLWNFCCCC